MGSKDVPNKKTINKLSDKCIGVGENTVDKIVDNLLINRECFAKPSEQKNDEGSLDSPSCTSYTLLRFPERLTPSVPLKAPATGAGGAGKIG